MTWIDFIAFLSFLEQREFGLRLPEQRGPHSGLELMRERGHVLARSSLKRVFFSQHACMVSNAHVS